MKTFYISVPNIKSKETGLINDLIKTDPAAYLLGIIKEKETKRVYYTPERFSYKRKFFPNYQYFLFNKEIERWNNPEIIKFFENYQKFISDNPYFIGHREKAYKPPMFEPKKRKILVDGVWKTRYRIINEPKEDLKKLQEEAAKIISNVLKYYETDSAHGYVKNRSNYTNAIPHQKSKHFLQYDFKNFFPSINEKTIKTYLRFLKIFAIIDLEIDRLYPHTNTTQEIKESIKRAKNFLEILTNIALYKGGLPQGSPLSPILTNMVMHVFDTEMLEYCKTKDASSNQIMYTRYADDLTFSSFKPINIKKMTNKINELLETTKIRLNHKKTKYKTIGQSIYITGVKVSANNKLTYGSDKKENLKREIFQVIMNIKKGKGNLKESQELIGTINYARMIDKEGIDIIIKKYCRKFNIPIPTIYKYLTKI